MRSASGMYQKFINKFNETKCCPLCVRKFSEVAQETNFIQKVNQDLTKLENILDRVPNATKSAEMSLSEAERKLKKLNNLHSTWVDCERLSKTDIPELNRQKDLLEAELNSLSSHSEDAEDEIATVEIEISQLKELKQSVNELRRLKGEVTKIEHETSVLYHDLQESGLSKTMDEVQIEYEQVQADTKMIRARIDRLNNESRIKLQTLQGKQNRMRDLKQSQLELEFQLKEREKLFDDIKLLNQEVTTLKEQLAENQAALKTLPHQIEIAQTRLSEFKTDRNAKENTVLQKIQESKDSISQLTFVNEKILKFRQEGGPDRLKECIEGVKRLESQLKLYQQKVEDLNKQIDEIVNRKTELQLQQRNIKDNIQYRRMRKDLADAEKKIGISKTQLQNFDQRSIDLEYQEAEDKHAALVGEVWFYNIACPSSR